MRVLLIEDDRKAAKLLAKGLHEEGFVVDVAHSGEVGDELAASNCYDAIVLDRLLPRRTVSPFAGGCDRAAFAPRS